jgi:Zn-dependent alcohol dehydrogenase
MLAAVSHAFGKPLRLEEVEIRPPRAGEVAVELRACSICHSDLSYLDGLWGGPLPAVFGHEATGLVTAVGHGVGTVKEGDPVVVTLVRSCGRCYFCARGQPALCDDDVGSEWGPLSLPDGRPVAQGLRVAGFAEQIVVHASQAVRMPADVSPVSAAPLGCAVLTGFGAVERDAGVEAGSSVVVVGAGGVGLNSVQAAALAGAEPILVVEISEERRLSALSLGATHVVDPLREDGLTAVRGLTKGRGADAAVVTVGDAKAIERTVELVRRGGTIVVVGMSASGDTVGLDAAEIAHHGRRLVGSKVGSAQPQVDLPRLVDLYRAGRLKLDELVSGRYELAAINDALDAARSGSAVRNVIVFG